MIRIHVRPKEKTGKTGQKKKGSKHLLSLPTLERCFKSVIFCLTFSKGFFLTISGGKKASIQPQSSIKVCSKIETNS